MRIALFTETFLPRIDGVTNTLRHVLTHFAERGHATLMFAPHGAPAKFAETPIVPMRGVRFPLYPDFRLIPPWLALRRELDEFRPDVVHVLNPVTFGLGALLHARVMHRPVVASYHTDVPGFAARWGLGVFSSLLGAYLRMAHNLADVNLAPSAVTQVALMQQGYQRVAVWSRGVDAVRFAPAHRSDAWRLRLSGGKSERLILLYVGRLAHEKRIDWIRPVLDALPEACLAIVGEGPAELRLREIFRGTSTQFIGALQGSDLASAYASADLFTFAGANETFGNVVLEAAASGLPVVAPCAGGLIDHVVEGVTGLLCAPDRQAEFVENIRRLAEDDSLRRTMSMDARARALTRTWGGVLNELLDVYAKAIDAHAARNRDGNRRSVARTTVRRQQF